MVECQLPKLDVVGSNPISRSKMQRQGSCYWMPFSAMTITLKREHERILQQEIQRGRFRSPDDVFDHAFAALQEQDRKRIIKPPRKNLAQFLVDSPLAGAELNLER